MQRKRAEERKKERESVCVYIIELNIERNTYEQLQARERERETGTKYMNVVGTNGERREGFDHWVRFTRPT